VGGIAPSRISIIFQMSPNYSCTISLPLFIAISCSKLASLLAIDATSALLEKYFPSVKRLSAYV